MRDYLWSYCCNGGILWHLQKYLQYIIIEFSPFHRSLLSSFPPIPGIVSYIRTKYEGIFTVINSYLHSEYLEQVYPLHCISNPSPFKLWWISLWCLVLSIYLYAKHTSVFSTSQYPLLPHLADHPRLSPMYIHVPCNIIIIIIIINIILGHHSMVSAALPQAEGARLLPALCPSDLPSHT
jgi:hypothetical protein